MILSFDTWQERPPRKDFFFSRKPKIGPKCQAKCDKSNLLDIMDKAACFSGNNVMNLGLGFKISLKSKIRFLKIKLACKLEERTTKY